MSSVSDTPYRDLAVKVTTFATRATVALGVPTLLFFKLDLDTPTLKSPPGKLAAASLAVLSGPSTLYCALGALEGFVRACGYCFKAVTGNSAELNWDLCAKERTTIHGLVRGALSPLGGYDIMINEWNLRGSNRDEGSPRVLKEEYYVYSVPRSIGHGIINIGNWALRQLKWGSVWILRKMWKSACWATNQVVSFVQWSWKVMQPVRQFAWDIGVACWDGLCYVKNQAVSFVQWCWNATQPVRQLAWDTTVAVLTWSANRIIDLWNITWPLRSFVKWVVRDIVIDKVVWNLILETIIWKGLLKTVISDWIFSKFIGKLLIKTILLKGLWPSVIRPVLRCISFTFATAFNLIAWALQQAFRRGK